MSVLPSTPAGSREATLEDFENSAFSKYEAGLELITHPTGQHQGAGIYLMGYVAEMLLKSAYFRFKDHPADPARYEIDVQKRRDARTEADRLCRQVGIALIQVGIALIKDDGFHSIHFWSFLLRETRQDTGHPWTDILFDLNFRACTDRLHNNWRVSMRYYADLSLALDATSVAEDATWLVGSYTDLWR